MTRCLVVGLALLLAGCTTPLMLPESGSWDGVTELGPVYACKGGSHSFQRKCKGGWPLSLPSLPAPDIHYAELRADAATRYATDPSLIVLKDVSVEYLAELNGVIRGWDAQAIAGRRVPLER